MKSILKTVICSLLLGLVSCQDLIGPCLAQEKLCFGLPSNCINDLKIPCTQLVRMVSLDNPRDGMSVEMFGSNSEPGQWYAVGLSTDARMGDDVFVHCDLSLTGKVSGGEGLTKGHSGVTSLTRGTLARNMTTGQVDGYLVCSWTHKANAFVDSRSYNILDNKYHILLAHGSLGEDGRLSYHDSRSASDNPVSLQSVGIVISESIVPGLVRLHGSLMITVWVGIASLAIMIARHYKESWSDKTLCGVKIWFVLHRSFMIFAIIFAILGIISIFVHVGQWRGDSFHQYFGALASFSMILQPFGALFRCHPDHPKRTVFNWIHWSIGNLAHLSAMATIFSVIQLKSIKLPDPFYWILTAHIVIYVAIHLIMSCHSAIISSKKRAIDDAHESLKSYSVTAASTSGASPSSRIGEGFRQFMLGLYVVIVCVSTATLVLIVIFQAK